MALEGLSQENIDGYETTLLAQTPAVEPIGNVTLRAQLAHAGWSEELFWEIRNRLIERGLLAKGKGKGGSVRRVQPPEAPAQIDPGQQIQQVPAPAEAAAVVAAVAPAERDLYQPMVEVIKSRWAQDYRLDSLIAEVTAAQGSRPTKGKWTRPDITVDSLKTYPYVQGRHFDLITFEINQLTR